MSKITYNIAHKVKGEGIPVYLDGKHIGQINKVAGGYQYQPKGTKRKSEAEGGATVYPSLYACQTSLEATQP